MAGGSDHDALDHLAGPADALLDRVDRLLATAGAPDGHRIWPLLRRLRVLPGDAARALLACRSAPLTGVGAAARAAVRAYGDARTPSPPSTRGGGRPPRRTPRGAGRSARTWRRDRRAWPGGWRRPPGTPRRSPGGSTGAGPRWPVPSPRFSARRRRSRW